MRAALVALLGLAGLGSGCATLGLVIPWAAPHGAGVGSAAGWSWAAAAAGPYPTRPPDRHAYARFRAAHPDVLEPNYLPFMVQRARGSQVAGELLFFCRWDAAAMPLSVRIEPPSIPESLQDEFHPTDPRYFVAGIEHALRVWQRELEGLVSFRVVELGEPARLRIRLLGERAPAPRPDVVVLGTTDALLSGCRVHGRDAEAGSQRVSFAVPELSLYLADEHGLLTPGQVERVALHEIGHALGMLGHSPDPHDMMYAAYRERSDVETLSQEDVNSFVSLYRLPNGADYALLPRGAAPPRPPPFPPGGVPVLAPAPQVDAMRGFSIRVPEGWLAMESPRGLFAANGPTWDFDTSLELAVWPYPKVSELLRRYGPALLGDGWLRTRAAVSLAGFSGQRIVFEDRSGSRLHDVRVLELGDGRVLMVAAQMPVEAEEEWLPWLDASLATLQVWEGSRD